MKRYSRSFITLRQERPEYCLKPREALGSGIIEVNNGMGRLILKTQYLKPEVIYKAYMIAVLDGKSVGVMAGPLAVDSYGKGELKCEFSPEDVFSSGLPIDAFGVLAVFVNPKEGNNTNDVIVALSGYKDTMIMWKRNFEFYNRLASPVEIPVQQQPPVSYAHVVETEDIIIRQLGQENPCPPTSEIPSPSTAPEITPPSVPEVPTPTTPEEIPAPVEQPQPPMQPQPEITPPETPETSEPPAAETPRMPGVMQRSNLPDSITPLGNEAMPSSETAPPIVFPNLQETSPPQTQQPPTLQPEDQPKTKMPVQPQMPTEEEGEIGEPISVGAETIDTEATGAEASVAATDILSQVPPISEEDHLQQMPQAEEMDFDEPPEQDLNEGEAPPFQPYPSQEPENQPDEEDTTSKELHLEFKEFAKRFSEELGELKNYVFLTDEQLSQRAAQQPDLEVESMPEQLSRKKAMHRECKRADYIFGVNERVKPFMRQNREVNWVKITLRDLTLLPIDHYKYANNVFVASAYKKWQHLILGITEDLSGRQYILGVPDRFSRQFKLNAGRLGFVQFKTCADKKAEDGDFGYWLMPIIF